MATSTRLRTLTLALIAGLALSLAAALPGSPAERAAPGPAPISAELADVLAVAGDARVEVIVVFHERAGVDRLARLAAPALPLRTLPMAGALLTADEIAQVRSWPEVRSVAANAPLQYLSNQSVPATGAPEVWAEGITGEGVGIAVLDTGIDGTHPDLSYPDKTVAQVKFLHTRIGSWAHGMSTETEQTEIEGLANTDTTSGHGTHVAGIAAGTGARDPNTRGMAPGASLIGLGAGDDLYVYEALRGFDWLLSETDGVANHERYDVRVVNNSWGGGGGSELDLDDPIIIATYEAYRAGMTVVFAAGNSGPDPDTFNARALGPWSIGVASTNKGFLLDGFSSRGYPNHPFKTPDVSAPGSSIRAANFAAWAALPYTAKSGTSMAAPHVAGLAALLLEANPDLSPDQVADIVRAATFPVENATASWESGSGFIDAYAAYELALETVGEREAFLAGQTAHTMESAAVTPLPYDRVETAATGTAGPGSAESVTFTVEEEAEFLTALLTWDGTVRDLDVILTSPSGEEHRASTAALDRALNVLASSDAVRVKQPEPGVWTAQVEGVVALETDFALRLVRYLVDEDGNW